MTICDFYNENTGHCEIRRAFPIRTRCKGCEKCCEIEDKYREEALRKLVEEYEVWKAEQEAKRNINEDVGLKYNKDLTQILEKYTEEEIRSDLEKWGVKKEMNTEEFNSCKYGNIMDMETLEDTIEKLEDLGSFIRQLYVSLNFKRINLIKEMNISDEVARVEKEDPNFGWIVEPLAYNIISLKESPTYESLMKLSNIIREYGNTVRDSVIKDYASKYVIRPDL